MKCSLSLLFFALVLILSGCDPNMKEQVKITVSNSLDMDREFETIELQRADLKLAAEDSLQSFGLENAETKEMLTTQAVDQNGYGRMDVLLFQPKIKANGTSSFVLVRNEKILQETDSIPVCFSRFVPERTDDYAWENNKVGFRTYGPVAQKMVEDSVAGGTLSSGIDAWLKRVEYPIINKWYKKTTEKTGTYHEDTGEGLDNFHVGASRGVGGVAVKMDTSYYFSKNFTSWKTITTGPLRTSFVLTYADWDANGKKISEEKHISLDYGNNLSRFEVHLNGTDTLAVGLTFHEQEGLTGKDLKNNWISYWEPIDDSEIGTGIVGLPDTMVDAEEYKTTKTDESNYYALFPVKDGKVVYYAGFGWKKSGQFVNQTAWESYLNDFSKKLKSPLEVSIE